MSASAFPELYLARLWSSGYLFGKTLTTDDGRSVEIHNPGRENDSNGPDFQDAVLLLDRKPVHGSVELHVQSEDWFTHRHSTDPAYNHCILHVSFYNLPGYESVPAKNGTGIPHLTLSKMLSFQDLIGVLSLQEKLNFKTDIPCGGQLQGVSHTLTKAWLTELGHLAFLEKVNRFAIRLKELTANPVYLKGKRYVWDQLLFEGFFRALGYPSNKERFERLARELPVLDWPDITGETGQPLLSEWFFLAGLEEEPEFGVNPIEKIRKEILQRGNLFHPSEWKTKSVRAVNQPEERLKSAAELVGRYYQTGFLKPLILTLEAHLNMGSRPEKIFPDLMNLLSVKSSPAYRIGKERKASILFNTWFPVLYLYAREFKRPDLQDLVLNLCDSFPHRQDIAIDKTMRQKFGITDHTTTFHWGLLNLYNNWCSKKKCLDCRIGKEIRKNG